MYSIPKPPSFSHLESSIIQNEVEPRPNSRKMNNVWHNAWLPTREVNELDFKYAIEPQLDGLSDLQSLHGVFNAVQLNTHFAKETNFSDYTSIQCLKADGHSLSQNSMGDNELSGLLRGVLTIGPLRLVGKPLLKTHFNLATSFASIPDGILTCREHPYQCAYEALRHILTVSIQRPSSLIEDPFDIHVLLSTLSFEASKYHITHFRRFMWSQFNKVEEQIGGGTKDRAELRELTRKLQIISQNADSHIANADVAIISAKGIHAAHAKLHMALESSPCSTERGADTIKYVINSLEKQKLWFLNYKNRKDGMMSLVFNLVTQQDAANSIEIAADTKRDSTSMNAIAALTMVFLPGTFTATILGAGIFSASTNGLGIRVSNLWWLWIAFTVPLTLGIMLGWWYYRQKEKKIQENGRLEHEREAEKQQA
ncbi:hypothetical protein TCE0_034r12194 [Talaromyces pinophilus]|uniref:Uncharacterized protein n=1 Tax=Talaromyces pinophilus TaxID=128442 RepID=A0A6V8HIS4_TALPI|nr:hypothetical protein TCE0_034r12194 [Talaromyces pinophilus]